MEGIFGFSWSCFVCFGLIVLLVCLFVGTEVGGKALKLSVGFQGMKIFCLLLSSDVNLQFAMNKLFDYSVPCFPGCTMEIIQLLSIYMDMC